MGFWKEVKKEWTREGIKADFQAWGWQGFLSIFVGLLAANYAVKYFNADENVWLHLALFFSAGIFGYTITNYMINLIRKWKEKNS